MMTFLLILLALAIAGLITMLIAEATAPVGYEDESGFHFGHEHAGTRHEWEPVRVEKHELIFPGDPVAANMNFVRP